MVLTRRIIVAFFTFMTIAALLVIARAGDWAVVTLDTLPVEVVLTHIFFSR